MRRDYLELLLQCYLQAGLIERWTVEVLERAQFNSQRRQRKVAKENIMSTEEEDAAGTQKVTMALTVIHMQGPLFLYLVGVCLSFAVFLGEISVTLCHLDRSINGLQNLPVSPQCSY